MSLGARYPALIPIFVSLGASLAWFVCKKPKEFWIWSSVRITFGLFSGYLILSQAFALAGRSMYPKWETNLLDEKCAIEQGMSRDEVEALVGKCGKKIEDVKKKKKVKYYISPPFPADLGDPSSRLFSFSYVTTRVEVEYGPDDRAIEVRATKAK
ncbi:MAG: hypothetical protein CO113_09300 [Elusimicrobia bacterium CG_4_9_14_3_um_filter_62_55]|nr:MAG: hypothetical protein COX66_06955 [Elusimicrobia bacterium CG_4_10_14_0_2_um_filter_63_34]PJB25333.1 MAG: hypothetical protein CO113_09300 [Elusimicrobia bacterium CG_4_9_14_3_um_filter_62_55]